MVFMRARLALVLGCASAHIPPSPAEMKHLQHLRESYAKSQHARQLSAVPDYTCTASSVGRLPSEKWKVSGTSLGGWLVLEPWLTPSLFYQFLGADIRYGPDIDKIKEKTGMDQKSFCTAL